MATEEAEGGTGHLHDDEDYGNAFAAFGGTASAQKPLILDEGSGTGLLSGTGEPMPTAEGSDPPTTQPGLEDPALETKTPQFSLGTGQLESVLLALDQDQDIYSIPEPLSPTKETANPFALLANENLDIGFEDINGSAIDIATTLPPLQVTLSGVKELVSEDLRVVVLGLPTVLGYLCTRWKTKGCAEYRRHFRRVRDCKNLRTNAARDCIPIPRLLDGFVQVVAELLSPPTEEELVMMDTVLYFLQRNQASEYCAALLDILTRLHNVRTRNSYLGFRYSPFWSEGAVTGVNNGFSGPEQVLAIALFRWDLRVNNYSVYDCNPQKTLQFKTNLKVLTPEEELDLAARVKEARKDQLHAEKVLRGEAEPDPKKEKERERRLNQRLRVQLYEIGVVLLGCLLISAVMLLNARDSVAVTAGPLLKYTGKLVDAEVTRYLTLNARAVQLAANSAEWQGWDLNEPATIRRFDEFMSRVQRMLVGQSTVSMYLATAADGNFRQVMHDTLVHADDFAAAGVPFQSTPFHVHRTEILTQPGRCVDLYNSTTLPPVFLRKQPSSCGFDPRSRTWYQLVANASSTQAGIVKVFLSDPYVVFGGTRIVSTLAVPVFFPNGSLYGVFGSDLYADHQNDLLEALRQEVFPGVAPEDSGIAVLAGREVYTASFFSGNSAAFNKVPTMDSMTSPAEFARAATVVNATIPYHIDRLRITGSRSIQADPLVFLSGVPSVLETSKNVSVIAYVRQQAMFTFEKDSMELSLIVTGVLLLASVATAFAFRQHARKKHRENVPPPSVKMFNFIDKLCTDKLGSGGGAAAAAAAAAAGPGVQMVPMGGAAEEEDDEGPSEPHQPAWRHSAVAARAWFRIKMKLKMGRMKGLMAASPMGQLAASESANTLSTEDDMCVALARATDPKLQQTLANNARYMPIAEPKMEGYLPGVEDDTMKPPPKDVDLDGDGVADSTDWQSLCAMLQAAIMLVTVYFVWNFNISNTMDKLVVQTTQATFDWLSVVSLNLFQVPFLANTYFLITLELGDLPLINASNPPPHPATLAVDSFMTRAITVFPDISFYGAGQPNQQLVASSPGVIKYRPIGSPGDCRYRYGLDAIGARNLSKFITTTCPYMTAQRAWYTDAPLDMSHGYTRPYVFAVSGNIGITAVQRFPADPRWGLEGVIGSDYNLGFLANFMQTIDFKGLDATVFFVDRSGALLATSLGSLDPPVGCKPSVTALIDFAPLSAFVKPLTQRFGPKFYLVKAWQGLVGSPVGDQLVAMQGLPGYTGMDMLIVLAVAKQAFFQKVDSSMRMSLGIGLLNMTMTLFLAYTVTYIMNMGQDELDTYIQKLGFNKVKFYTEKRLRERCRVAFLRSLRFRGPEMGLHVTKAPEDGVMLSGKGKGSGGGGGGGETARTPRYRAGSSDAATAALSPRARRYAADATVTAADDEEWEGKWESVESNAAVDGYGRMLSAKDEELAIMKYGRNCIDKSFAGYDVEKLIDFEIAGDWGRRKMFLIFHSKQFSFFISCVIALHLSLAFLEAPVSGDAPAVLRGWLTSASTVDLTVIIEGFCYVIHIIDFILLVVTGSNSITGFQMSGIVVVRTVLQTVFQIDYFYRLATRYTTGCLRLPSDPMYNAPDCVTMLIPYTAVLRPILLVLRRQTLRRSFQNFFTTLFLARDVLVLMFIFVLLGSAMGLALLFQLAPSSYTSFSYLQPSVFTMFTFIVTADNYPDIQQDPLSAELLYSIFFILYSAVGLFLMVSLFIAVFEDEYSTQHAQGLDAQRFSQELGSMITFLLLDKQKRGRLSIHTVSKFFNKVCFVDVQFAIDDGYLDTPEHRHHKVITLAAFRKLVRRLQPRMFIALDPKGEGSTQQGPSELFSDAVDAAPLLRKVVRHPLYLQVILLVGMLQLWMTFQYGTFPTATLDSANMAFIGFYTVEMILRVFAFKWGGFWNVPNDVYIQMGNRFDFFITMMSLFAFLASRYGLQPGATQLGFGTGNDPSRVVLALPLFRLLSAIESVRVMVLGLLFTLPSYSDLALQLLCLFYSYGVIGCLLFSRQFVLVEGYSLPEANFDSFIQALLTLFQLLAGANWSTIMDASTQIVGTGTMVTLYFISFVLLMGLLFTNLLIGIIISAFSIVMTTHKTKGANGVSTYELMDAMSADARTDEDDYVDELLLVDMKTNTVHFKRALFSLNLPVHPVVPAPQPTLSLATVLEAEVDHFCPPLSLKNFALTRPAKANDDFFDSD